MRRRDGPGDRYVSILGAGYFVSRGLAKSGSREPYTDEHGRSDRQGVVLIFTKRPGRRADVRFMPGCLMWSLLLSIGLTILLNVVIRLL